MKRSLLMALAILIANAGLQAAELKKWTDENGKVHYGAQAPSSVKTEKLAGQVSVVKGTSKDERVILYSTSWCGYCKKARSFMRREKISFNEYDIEKSATAKREYELAGGKGVPLLVKGEKSLQGFSSNSYRRFFSLTK